MKSYTPTTWFGKIANQFYPTISSTNPEFRATWHGSRIIMRQVSWESQHVFDFILETHRACDGNWELLAERVGVSDEAMEGFLEYAAVFLGNIGNYYVRFDEFICY